jgi:hypothetical protein
MRASETVAGGAWSGEFVDQSRQDRDLLAGAPRARRAGEQIASGGHGEVLKDTLEMDIFRPPRQDWLDRRDVCLRR